MRGDVRLDLHVTPECYHMTDLFFSPELDGRKEVNRKARESLCKSICHACPYQFICLHRAMLNGEAFGVWGGMGEGDRRAFSHFMAAEGYWICPDEIDEFRACLKSFIRWAESITSKAAWAEGLQRAI